MMTKNSQTDLEIRQDIVFQDYLEPMRKLDTQYEMQKVKVKATLVTRKSVQGGILTEIK